MRICVLSDHIPPHVEGGASGIAWTHALELHKRGHSVLVITTSQHARGVHVEQREGIEVHTLPATYHLRWRAYRGLWNPRVVGMVRDIFLTWRPDVVHAHNVHTYLSYHTLVVAKKLKCNVVLTCHDVMSFNYGKLTNFAPKDASPQYSKFSYGIDPWRQFKEHKLRYNPFRNIYIRWVLRSSVDSIIAVSYALKDALEQNGIQPIVVVHNGIESSLWRVARVDVDSFKDVYTIGDHVILYAGRLSTIKGGLQLIEALPTVLSRVPTAQLLVVGVTDGNTKEMLDVAKKLGVEKAIITTGLLRGDTLHTAFNAATVIAAPSLCFDSLPTVVLEAMACRKPVVATFLGGSREMVEESKTGNIINPYDVPALAEALVHLLDTRVAQELGARGYERVVQDFSLTKQIDAYEKLYKPTI